MRVVPRFQDLPAGGQQERGRGRHDPVQVVGVAARVVEHGPGDAVRPDVGLGDLPVGETVRAVGLDERHGDHVDGARVAPDVGGELRDLLLAVLAGGRPEDQERRPPVRGAAGEGHVPVAHHVDEGELRRAAADHLVRGIVRRDPLDRRRRRSLRDPLDHLLRGQPLGRHGHELRQPLDLRDHEVPRGVDQRQVRDIRHVEQLRQGEPVVHQQRQVGRPIEHAEPLPQHLGALILPPARDGEHLVLRRLVSKIA